MCFWLDKSAAKSKKGDTNLASMRTSGESKGEYLNERRVSEALTRLESFYRDEISNIVENLDHKQTILHGDYHFANIMFLKNCETSSCWTGKCMAMAILFTNFVTLFTLYWQMMNTWIEVEHSVLENVLRQALRADGIREDQISWKETQKNICLHMLGNVRVGSCLLPRRH